MFLESAVKIIQQLKFPSLMSSTTPVPTMVLIPGFAAFSLTFDSFYDKMLTVAVSIAIMVAVILVTSAGYSMMTSLGSPDKIKAAKAQIQDAIMGLLLILLAATVVKLVFDALGITAVKFTN